jgi:hypothetical protein
LGSQNARAELSVGETIEVRRLDSVFNECMEGLSSHRLYLKLGAQGSEALQGAQGVLDKFLAAQSEPIYQGVPSSLESLREFRRNAFDVVDFMPV